MMNVKTSDARLHKHLLFATDHAAKSHNPILTI